MHAISKNVAMGMLITLVLLSPLVSCSLNSLFSSEQTGNVEIALTIPESLGRSALPTEILEALVPPESEASRFIHPDTRLIEVSIAIDGGPKTLSASSAIQAGATTASVSIKRVPMGEHIVTVSLYDTSTRATLLSRGSASITVKPRSVSRPSISAVPITRLSFSPGPYGTDGVTVNPAQSNQVLVYDVSLPATGSYMLRCYNFSNKVHEPEDIALYDAKGKHVNTVTGGSGSTEGQYATLSAGTYYVVVQAPDLGRSNYLEVSLNADLRLSISGQTIYVRPGLSVMDRTRPFTITVPSGYSAIGTLSFGGAEGSGTPVIEATDSRTITVRPGTNALIAQSSESGFSLTFTDALLGKAQTGTPRTPAALRTFVYCNPTGTVPTGSFGYGFTSFNSAITDTTNGTNSLGRDTGSPVLALNGSHTGVSALSITNDVCMLGGFSLDGSRPDGHGYGNVTFSAWIYALSMGAGADTSIFDSVNFSVPGGTFSTSGYPISISANADFINCTFRRTSALTLGAGLSYSLLDVSSDYLSFDRCSILGSTITLSGSGSTVYAINDQASVGANLRISNSLIDPGAFSGSSNGGTVCDIRMMSGTLSLSGSSLSAGQGSPTSTPILRPILLSGGCTLNAANDLILAGDMRSPGSAFVYSPGALTALNFDNIGLGYETGNPSSYAIYVVSGSQITFNSWPTNPSFGGNPLDTASSFSLSSLDPTNRNFLQPQAASPAWLLSGGAELANSVIRSDHHLSMLDYWVSAYDRAGAARTGNGATGYTIGAYEVD